jgi:hypothetical protein
MRNKAGPSSRVLSSVADAKKFLANAGQSVVGEHCNYKSFFAV